LDAIWVISAMNGDHTGDDSAIWLARTRARYNQRDWAGCLAAADAVLVRDTECLEAALMRASALLSLSRADDAVIAITGVI
jgi:hypothetical protein